jgi:hypothetical protein
MGMVYGFVLRVYSVPMWTMAVDPMVDWLLMDSSWAHVHRPWQVPDLWTCLVNPHLMNISCNIYLFIIIIIMHRPYFGVCTKVGMMARVNIRVSYSQRTCNLLHAAAQLNASVCKEANRRN